MFSNVFVPKTHKRLKVPKNPKSTNLTIQKINDSNAPQNFKNKLGEFSKNPKTQSLETCLVPALRERGGERREEWREERRGAERERERR